MNFDLLHPADQLVLFMNTVYQKGLTTTSGGNLSILDEDDNIWITPSGIDKGTLTRKDIMCVKPDGTIIGPHKPSIELPFHSSVYKLRPDLKAVLHAHPPALVSFSLTRKAPNTSLLPVVYNTCGTPVMAEYAIPGSIQLGKNISKYFEQGYNSIILENHGVCVASKTMYEAYMMLESLESSTTIEINAMGLGKPNQLSQQQLELSTKNKPLSEFEDKTHSTKELALRRDIIPFVHRCCAQNLFGSTRGTYSVRVDDNSFLITPEGKNLYWIEEDDIVLIKDGKCEKGKKPSIHAKLHELIYKNHPEINSIAASESLATSAFSVTGNPIDSRTIPESYIQLQTIGNAEYEDLYTSPEKIEKQLSSKTSVILCKNGPTIATGKNLTNAFDRLEVAEATAISLLTAQKVGKIICMSDSEIKDIDKAFLL